MLAYLYEALVLVVLTLVMACIIVGGAVVFSVTHGAEMHVVVKCDMQNLTRVCQVGDVR